MKISIWTSYYIDLSPEDAIKELAKDGLRYAELSDEHGATLLERGDPKAVGEAFKRFADGYGVKMPQGHLKLCASLINDENSVGILKKWIDLFRAIGIKRGVLHCDGMYDRDIPYKEKLHLNIERLKELAEYVKGTDFIICLENLCSMVTSIDDLLYVIKRVGGRNFGICLDTGHLNVNGGNQREFILKAGRKLKALHIADNEGVADQHMLPFGRGNVDIIETCKALKEIGYKDLYNFEIPGERNCPLEIRTFKAQYIKKIMKYIEKAVKSL